METPGPPVYTGWLGPDRNSFSAKGVREQTVSVCCVCVNFGIGLWYVYTNPVNYIQQYLQLHEKVM